MANRGLMRALTISDKTPDEDNIKPDSITITEYHSDEEEESDLPVPIPKRPGENSEPSNPMSLMALLETEGGGFGSFSDGDEGGEEEEGEEEEDGGDEEGGEELYQSCCVCMVRHKGAAFIPCGHTFCRLCSRELWVSRGNCPLCNGFILEILDIF